jgi:hypothetical protein
MITTDVALLDALADCLESGDTLTTALDKVAMARGAAEEWTHLVRRSVRSAAPVAVALRASNVLGDDELSFLSAEGADAAVVPVSSALRAVALRRRRSVARRRAIGWGLVVPFALGALTVVLDPLPNLLGGGPVLWPLLRGLFVLVALSLAIVAGVPALLRSPRARPAVLRLCAAIPGARRLTALYAEEELTTALTAFVDGGELRAGGLAAAASLLSWSPLGEALRDAARPLSPSGSLPMEGTVGGPMAGLEPLARQLSIATDLAIIGGVASRRLTERLAQRGEAIALVLTARLRLLARIGAYTLVILLSISSVMSLLSQGLPGIFTLPGGATSPEQKQLEDLMKQLEP